MGIMAMTEPRRTGQDGYGIALAGTIIGALVVMVIIVYIVVGGLIAECNVSVS